MRELDKRIATLRLRLAEIESRQEQLRDLQRQFKSQLDRIVEFTVKENGDLDTALSMSDEVEARLAQTERSLKILSSIKARGQEELEALQLTRSVDAAKAELAELEERHRQLENELSSFGVATAAMARTSAAKDEKRVQLEAQRDQLEGEMKRLRRVIDEASDAAARAVSSKTRKSRPDKDKDEA